MDSINLEPRYSSNEVPGRCIKCLAEEKLFSCMRELLKESPGEKALQEKYELLRTFLESPDLQEVCNQAEKLLADGKEVNVKIRLEAGKPVYELVVK